MLRRSLALTLILVLSAAPLRAENGVAGPYLAGRQAAIGHDYAAASNFYTRALLSDPSNPVFLEQSMTARMALGELDRALPMAEQAERLGIETQAANMIILADLARSARYEELIAELDAGRSAGQLVDSLLRAWSELGMGRMSEATQTFDGIIAEPALTAFGLYHKALALASVGDFEGADAILSGDAAGPLRATRRSLVAHAEILSQLERNADALELIQTAFGEELDPAIADLRDALAAGETVPFTVVRSPQDGIAEVMFTIAGAMNTEAPDVYALAYARLAAEIRPDFPDAILLAAGMLERQGQFDLAGAAYSLVSRDDPAYYVAELGRADALMKAGKPDAAIEVLDQLAKTYPDLALVWTKLADFLRREQRFEDAIRAYDNAIATFSAPRPEQWGVYYARGISHERAGNWPEAEADFRKALDLNPDQPDVLNYLGYSYLEKHTNLDEALSMIERAAAAEPDSGAIIDSLGWALYRLGRYEDAVAPMEKAVELMPDDPVINDHLGDVYWSVGRKLEAEFQWKRALSFIEPGEPTDADPDRIRRKLEVGLDAVLKQEGSAPVSVSENAD